MLKVIKCSTVFNKNDDSIPVINYSTFKAEKIT